jgi:putative ABC transport system permease protein
MRPPVPPPLAERLLRLAIRDAEWRDAVSGDLAEEFAVAVRRRGLHAAKRWYWRHALVLSMRFAASRVIPAARPPRGWRPTDADLEPARSWTSMRDVLYAWRVITHRPGVSAAIVGTLALALAANATVFNLADALYLRPFRFPGVDRLVIVSSAPDNDPGADHSSVAPADFRDWQRESTTLASLAAAAFWDPNMSGVDEPEQVPGFLVSPAFFQAIDARPLFGRTFVDSEAVPGQDRRVVLSHGLWARRFGSDPAIVGRTIRFDGEPYEVVGVMRAGIAIPYGAQVWAPLSYTEAQWSERRRGGLLVVGRLADGQSIGTARAELASIVERQRRAYPDTNARRELTVVSFTRGLADGFAAPIIAIWQAAAMLLLAIACANIVNLLLARGAARQQEFAVRLALGAGRWRIARQLLFEGAWLALVAVAMTVPLAMAGAEATRRGMPPGIARWVPGIEFIRLDPAVLGVMMGLGVLATLFFSWLPALQASNLAASHALREGGRAMAHGRSRGWLGTGLVVAQVAAAVCLVVGAGLVLGGVDRAVNGALGFDRRHVLTAELRLDGPAYVEPEQRRQFVAQVLDRLRGIPAVHTVAAGSSLPFTASGTQPVYPEGVQLTAAEVQQAKILRVTPAYLDALRIPLNEGRAFSDADRPGTSPVAIVSRSFGTRYWPGQSPLGRRFRASPDGPWLEVVGVVGDVVQDLLMNRESPSFYRPSAQEPTFTTVFLVRTGGDPLDLSGELRRAIAALDPDLPLLSLRSMEQVVAERAGGITHLSRLLGVMSAIALLLALMGVYSLMAYVTLRRTQEFGVRIALGATRWQVIRASLGHVGVITGLGLVLGTALAVALGRVMSSALFGLVSLDFAPVAIMVVGLGATALAAGFIPARRAAALDPTEALRTP